MLRKKHRTQVACAYSIEPLEGRVLLSNTPAGLNINPEIIFNAGSFNTLTVTATGSPPPSVTFTGTLPSHISFHDNGNGSATISGTPAAADAGGRLIKLIAQNGIGSDATQFVAFDVDVATQITSSSHTGFAVGMNNTFNFTTAGFPAADLMESGDALPTGVMFVNNDDGTATLSGTPAAGTERNYNLTITTSNPTSSVATQSFVLTVGSPPVFSNASSATFNVGTQGTFTFTTTATPAADLSLTTLTLPTGLMFTNNNNGTATLSGTPAAGTQGDYPLTINADNGIPSGAVDSFTLHITNVPTVPTTITSADSTRFAAGVNNSFTFTTDGFPAADVMESGGLPSGVTFVNNDDGTATLAGTPTVGTNGFYRLAITTANGGSSTATQDFELEVTETPVIQNRSGEVKFTVGMHGLFGISTLLATSPLPQISVSGTLPPGVSFADHHDGDGVIEGTPAAGSEGTYPFVVTARNGDSPAATTAFTLTVGAPPAFTSAATAGFAAGAHKVTVFNITTSGFPAAAITKTGVLPDGLKLATKSDGTAVIAGQADTVGVFKVTLTASNGVGAAATQKLVITVGNPPKITSAQTAKFNAGATGTFQITTTGTPVATITTSDPLPAGFKLKQTGKGIVTLAGKPTLPGVFSISLIASNGVMPNNKQRLIITVQGAPVFTSANSQSITVGESSHFNITTAGVPTAAFSIKKPPKKGGPSTKLPPGLSLRDDHDGKAFLSGTTTKLGTFTVTLVAKNNLGTTSQQFTINVVPAPAFTSNPAATFEFGFPSTFTITTNGRPAVTSIAATGDKLPVGLSFKDNGDGTATLSGTPADLSDGTYSLTLTAANAAGDSVTQNFVLTVLAPPTFPLGEVNGLVSVRYPNGTQASAFEPFPDGVIGASSVASADFNGDGVPDIVAGAPSGNSSAVRLFNGKTNQQIGNTFLAFGQAFAATGGISVAAGDVNGDGTPDIIVGSGSGMAATVKVFDGHTFGQIASFSPFSSTGGVSVAAADFDGDGKAEVVTVQSGAGPTPGVQVFEGRDLLTGFQTVIRTATPFDPSYTGGAFVAVGDVNNDGTPDILVSPAAGFGPDGRVLDGRTLNLIRTFNFLSNVGYGVSSVDVNRDGFSDILIIANVNGTKVSIFSGADGSQLFSYFAGDGI